MRKSDVRILIVEDDDTLGPAAREALKRQGFSAKWVSNPDEAQTQLHNNDFQLAIIDCMLPRTNGVELAEKLRKEHPHLRLILTSGIFKDKTFAKESLQKTGASEFLIKPFEVERLVGAVESAFAGEIEADLHPLWEVLTKKDLSANELTEVLKSCSSIHGYDLALIYSLVIGSPLTGSMQVISADGGTSVLTLHQGHLTQVQIQDKRSYFGVLLVEMGFTSNEDVERGLNEPSELPLGERLVASQAMSPHAIKVVKEEQMLIRLSKTLQNTIVDVKFEPKETAASNDVIDRTRLRHLLWDWVHSKLTEDYVHAFLGRWLEHQFIIPDPALVHRRTESLPGMELRGEVLRQFQRPAPLSEGLAQADMYGPEYHRLLVFLVLDRLAHFGPKKTSTQTADRLLQRLTQLVKEAKEKNYFDILGISRKASSKEVAKGYMDIAKIYHPDKVSAGAPKQVRDLANEYFALVTQAHDVLKDQGRREQYLYEIEQGSAEKILNFESLYEQGLVELRKGNFKRAYEMFSRLRTEKYQKSELSLAWVWARVKLGTTNPAEHGRILSEAGAILSRIPPEDRHSAIYFFVKGLYYLELGEWDKSKTNLKHALVIDPGLVEARRELAVVRQRIRTREATFTGELSTVVNMIFGRKTKRGP